MADDAPALKILLVDDSPMNQVIARRWLARLGYTIDVAGDGEEAVSAVERFDFDVVLMDINMPKVDGLEATRRIRALPPPKNRVPIIALTASADPNLREELRAAGLDDYLSKPLNFDVLFGKLAAL
jgi:CheY-like chemotaxis protein